ncbi:hypothetical protein FA15DRAFT_665995 [Coprinopsis marcescibilis]|uniref:Arrestin-like N-terminal domain-containing protein n=1 Tax=Coprinopsis marcescibilis TaxID=230819 RepID=A0A5C3L5E8_COPMA|nr:hypothetical protein FA15DRAFT_665995 [Coprinopsis marcescibilis]
MMFSEASVVSPPLPPSYSADPEAHSGDDEPQLPAYNQRDSGASFASHKEFTSALKRKGKPLVNLVLVANQGLSKVTPTFVEGMAISGRVELDLDRPQTINEVSVAVKGSLISIENSGDQQLFFLNVQKTIWSPAMGDPYPSQESPNSSPSTVGHASRLSGSYEWQFSVDLPREVVLPYGPRKQLGVFKLPQTFMERHARATICYEVALRIRRGRLKPDYRVNLTFGYIPLIRPERPSILRQYAYQEHNQIPSPDIDLDGWHSSDLFKVKGRLFGRSATVECILSVATPLCFTRGTAVPISLLLKSDDVQALDLLSSPKSVVCRLRRVIKYHAGQEKSVEPLAWKDGLEDSQSALWWPCAEVDANTRHRRRLSGELHLRKDLKPTTAIGGFRIEYSVAFFSFDALAFDALDKDTQPLASVPVEIATMYAKGPHPRMYAPPSYEDINTRYLPDDRVGMMLNSTAF